MRASRLVARRDAVGQQRVSINLKPCSSQSVVGTIALWIAIECWSLLITCSARFLFHEGLVSTRAAICCSSSSERHGNAFTAGLLMSLTGLDLLKQQARRLPRDSRIRADILAASMSLVRSIVTPSPSSPYYGQDYEILLLVPAEYPQQPLAILVMTPIFHPNVDALGIYRDWRNVPQTGAAGLRIYFSVVADIERPRLGSVRVMSRRGRFRRTLAYYGLAFSGHGNDAWCASGHPANTHGFYGVDRAVLRFMAAHHVTRRVAIHAVAMLGLRYSGPARV